jgi:hypothetical protein
MTNTRQGMPVQETEDGRQAAHVVVHTEQIVESGAGVERVVRERKNAIRWSEFRPALLLSEHRRLVLGVTTALREAHVAAKIVRDDGDVDELRLRIETAIGWLEEARRVLGEQNSGSVPGSPR